MNIFIDFNASHLSPMNVTDAGITSSLMPVKTVIDIVSIVVKVLGRINFVILLQFLSEQ